MSDDYDWTPHLQEGEEVLWQGRPDGRFRLFLSGWDFLLVPFFFVFLMISALVVLAVCFGLFVALFCILSGGSECAPNLRFDGIGLGLLFPLFLYIVVGRAWLDRRRRLRLRYAVTQRRVLKASIKEVCKLTSKAIAADTTIDVTFGKLTTIRLDPWPNDDRKPVSVASGAAKPALNINAVLAQGYLEQGFELRMLPDGRDVAKLLRQLKSSLVGATP